MQTCFALKHVHDRKVHMRAACVALFAGVQFDSVISEMSKVDFLLGWDEIDMYNGR